MAGASEEQRRQAEADSDLMDMVASIPARQYLHFPGVPVSADDLTEILEASR
jgi:beta-glucosidase